MSPDRLTRRRWAMLIQRVYQADPLLCPKCGGTMKIIAFIEACQNDVIRKILQHRGLWDAPHPTWLGHRGPGQRDVGYLDIHEDDQIDEAQLAGCVKQASQLPGERM